MQDLTWYYAAKSEQEAIDGVQALITSKCLKGYTVVSAHRCHPQLADYAVLLHKE